MPLKAPTICPRCNRPKASGMRCECAPRQRSPDRRPSARARGYTSEWDNARADFLKAHPHCVRCGARASIVDHIQPHKGSVALFWNPSNWQPMCTPCHSGAKQREERRAERHATATDARRPLAATHNGGAGSTPGKKVGTGVGRHARISPTDFPGGPRR